MTKMLQTITLSRLKPRETISRSKLESLVGSFDEGKLKELNDGSVCAIWPELLFMQVIYHVALYVPEPKRFQPDRMRLAVAREFDDDFNSAIQVFENLDS